MNIKGFITKIVYSKPGFLIFTIDNKIKVKYTKQIEFNINEKQYVSMEGEFIQDKYGRTFIAETIELTDAPSYSVNKLSLFIDGIGDMKAKEIENSLGPTYIEILEKEPIRIFDFFISSKSSSIMAQFRDLKPQIAKQKYSDVPKFMSKYITGIGIKKVNEWIASLGDNPESKILDDELAYKFLTSDQAWNVYTQIKNIKIYFDIVSKIKGFGYSEKIADLIIEKYRLDSINRLINNPYIPVEFGVDFEDCDDIAVNKLSLDTMSMHRIVNATTFILKRHEEEGNTFALIDVAVEEVSEIIGVEDVDYIKDIIHMNASYEEPEFIINGDKLYRRIIFFTERKISLMLKDKIKHEKNVVPEDVKAYVMGSGLSEKQKSCVVELLRHNISILTGGPGTGKTRTISVLCNSLDRMKKKYILCAPTGRASKRMTESTGREAKTIYRTLEYKPMGLIGKFMKNENYPIDADYVIVDEASMLDVYIMNSLLKALKPHTSLILVGDVNQLPSISMGSILKDLKESGKIYVGMLTEIFRQSENSLISINANKIMNAEPLIKQPKSDFAFIKISDTNDLNRLLEKIVARNKEFQILCPMKNGPYGTTEINYYMQNKLNGHNKAKSIYINNRLFSVGDKVIQMRNDYNKEVFNGEIGTIEEITEDEVKISFPQNTPSLVRYKYSEMRKVDHSYSITIHKSQGSEFDNVIMIVDGNKKFLSKELVYTGMTRAKKTLTIISLFDIEFYEGLSSSNIRATNLKELLQM